MTDIQKAQRYEITLSQQNWTLDNWRQAKIPQDKICAMVARMAAINQLIIEHEGGNEFHG